LTANQEPLDFKQQSLPHKTPEGIKQGSPPSLKAPALLRGWSSHGLAHHSTEEHAGGLNYRVRYGTGCFPTAMTVKPPLPWKTSLCKFKNTYANLF